MHEVVAGALVREGRVLLVHRSPNRGAYPGLWSLPGGHVEAGEPELGALARELREELGVQISVGSVVPLCRVNAGPGSEAARISVWLIAEWQGTIRNAAPEEHDEIRWFQAGDLPPLAHHQLGTVLMEALMVHGS